MKSATPSRGFHAVRALGVLLWALCAVPTAATAAVRTATLHYASAGGAIEGYENASVEVKYNIMACVGSDITIAAGRVKGSVKASPRYWYDGSQVAASAPPPSAPLVPFSGVVLDGGRIIGSFSIQAGDVLGFGCFSGDTQVVAKLSDHVGPKATQEEKERFVSGLTIRVNPADKPLENAAIGRLVDAERRKAKAAAQAAERAKQAEVQRQEKERQAEAARKQRESEAQRKASATSSAGSTGQGAADFANGNYWGTAPDPAGMAVDYVRSNDGRFFRKDGTGQFQEVSASEYNLAQTTRHEERQRAAEAERQRQNNAEAERVVAQHQRDRQEAERANQLIDRQMDRLNHSFYAAQAVGRISDNINELSSLNGNYATAAELEADFKRRNAALRREMRNMEAAQERAVRAQTDLYWAESDPAVGEVMNMVGNMMAESEREEQERRARAKLQRQREEMRQEIAAKQAAMQLEMRKSLLEQFPDGNVPLSSHKVSADTLYFFSYTFDRDTIAQPRPMITLANTFAVQRYDNGTWPFKIVINREIRAIAPGENTLMGFYGSKELADSMRQSFIRLAQEGGFELRDMKYAGKVHKKSVAGASTAAAPVDFWAVPAGNAAAPKKAGSTEKAGKAPKADAKPQVDPNDFWR